MRVQSGIKGIVRNKTEHEIDRRVAERVHAGETVHMSQMSQKRGKTTGWIFKRSASGVLNHGSTSLQNRAPSPSQSITDLHATIVPGIVL